MSGKLYVFNHHMYEFRKGLRNLVLFTTTKEIYEKIVHKLNKYNIAYIIQPVTDSKVNVFFGHPDCIEAVRRFTMFGLDQLTPEEDFMLGLMLGYDITKQCRRYIDLTNSKLALSTA